MKKQTLFIWKGTIVALAACFVSSAQADLQLKITVSGTSATVSGTPSAGDYEVDYQGSRARIVAPDGGVSILDFNSSQVAVLNSSKQTYYVMSLQQALGAGKKVQGSTGSSSARNVMVRATSATETLFGVTLTKYSILPEPLASNGNFRSGGIGNLLASAVFQQPGPLLPFGQRAGSRANQSSSSSSSQSVPTSSLSGSAWLADSTTIGQTIPSSAPLAMIGAPAAVSYSLTQAFDADHALPLAIAFTWPGSTAGSTNTLAMSVTSAQITSLAASTTQVPSTYTEVAAR